MEEELSLIGISSSSAKICKGLLIFFKNKEEDIISPTFSAFFIVLTVLLLLAFISKAVWKSLVISDILSEIDFAA